MYYWHKTTFLLIPCLFRFCWKKRNCAYKHQSRIRSSYQCSTCNVGLCPQWTPGQKLDPTVTKKGKVHTLLTLFCSLDVRLSIYAFGNCLHAFSSRNFAYFSLMLIFFFQVEKIFLTTFGHLLTTHIWK